MLGGLKWTNKDVPPLLPPGLQPGDGSLGRAGGIQAFPRVVCDSFMPWISGNKLSARYNCFEVPV